MTSFALIFTLAAIGISETVYLIRKRIAEEQPACPIGGGCHVVLTSKYGRLFIVPNDSLGLLTYVLIAVLSALLVIGVGPLPLWSLALNVLVGAASLMSLFLIYLQWRVIKLWCFWCLMSAGTIGLMATIILVNA